MRLGEIMRGFVLGAVTAVALVAGGALAMQVSRNAPSYDQNALHPERVIIGLDLSKSNPLIDDPAFAARVGQRKIHFLLTVLENSQARDFLGQPTGVGFAVAGCDAQQHQQPTEKPRGEIFRSNQAHRAG